MQTVSSLAMGLALLLSTGVTAKVFLVLSCVWLILQGISNWLSSRKVDSNNGDRSLLEIIGIVMGLIGLVIVFWTNTGEVSIAWHVGIAASAVDGLLVYSSFPIKRLQSRIEDIGQRGGR